jgi:hypothetical protein
VIYVVYYDSHGKIVSGNANYADTFVTDAIIPAHSTLAFTDGPSPPNVRERGRRRSRAPPCNKKITQARYSVSPGFH